MKTRSEVYQSLQPQLQAFEEKRLAIKSKKRKRLCLFLFKILFCSPILFVFFLIPKLEFLFAGVSLYAAICKAAYGSYTGVKH